MKNKLLTMLDTKTKKIVLAGLVVVILCISGFAVYALTKEKAIVLSLKKDKQNIVVEYGDAINPTLEEYLDLSKLDKDDKEKVLKESKLESTLQNEENKEYSAIGEYKITFTYSGSRVVSKVVVKDTIAPVFNEVNEVSFEQGTDYDYATTIVATDLQEVTVTFDSVSVNKHVPGEYNVKSVAKDKSNNEATKDIKVIVTAKVIEETPNTSDGSASNGSNSKPSSNGRISSSGTGSNTSGTTPPPVQQPEAPHVHTFSPYANRWFNSGNEADTWAKEYEGPDGTWAGKTWGGNKCSCGKWGITSFQNITYWQ